MRIIQNSLIQIHNIFIHPKQSLFKMTDIEPDLNLPKTKVLQVQGAFTRRCIAFFIDLIIIQLVIISPFREIMKRIVPAGSFKESYLMLSAAGASSAIYAVSFFIALMIFIYFTFTEYIAGQSIGKKIMGLRVVSETEKLSLSQVILRNLAMLPFFPFIALWVIDPGFMMFTKTQRRLSDILARTNVIQFVRSY